MPLCFIIAAVLLTACAESSQRKIAQLQSSIDSLKAESEQKSQTINEFFASISSIEESLAEVRNRENSIGANMRNYSGQEIPSDVRALIDEDISAISGIMTRNRHQIARLNESLARSNIKATELERIIKSTEQKLNARDTTIARLMVSLERMNFNVDSLARTVDTLHSTLGELTETNQQLSDLVAAKDEKLNTAWYAVGKRGELIDNRVIENRLMEKNYRLLRDFNRDYFTRIDISQTDAIPLYSSGTSAVVATSHPAASYILEKDDNGKIKQLRIVDRESFWSASRYLVVVIK